MKWDEKYWKTWKHTMPTTKETICSRLLYTYNKKEIINKNVLPNSCLTVYEELFLKKRSLILPFATRWQVETCTSTISHGSLCQISYDEFLFVFRRNKAFPGEFTRYSSNIQFNIIWIFLYLISLGDTSVS